jgi:hypothetical protein
MLNTTRAINSHWGTAHIPACETNDEEMIGASGGLKEVIQQANQPALNPSEFQEFQSELVMMKMRAERMCQTAKEKFGPDGNVTYRTEEVSNSLQRLEWVLLRSTK